MIHCVHVTTLDFVWAIGERLAKACEVGGVCGSNINIRVSPYNTVENVKDGANPKNEERSSCEI